MRPVWTTAAWTAGLLILFAILDVGLSPWIGFRLFGGDPSNPQFLLTFGLVASLLVSPRSAMIIGFFSGALIGWMAGANFVGYTLSRMLACTAMSYLEHFNIDTSYVVVGLQIGIGTLFAGFIYMIVAPPSALLPFIAATIGSALFNAVLALPMLALLRWAYAVKSV